MSRRTLRGLQCPTPPDKTLSDLDAELSRDTREFPFMLERRGQMLPLISSGVFPMQPLPVVPKRKAHWWPAAVLVCVVTALVLWGLS